MSDAPVSAELFERAQRVIPGGVNSPVRAFRAVGGTPRFMTRASGPYVTDADGRTYAGAGLTLTDYYAYNKPILAPADGVVEEVVQHIEDNPIGEVNLRQNWGNTVVLRHAPGLYTQLSHLRPHSVPLKPGDAVRRGDIIGYCGSSGRSPEPHLHFQVQATPFVGSRTLAYPLAYFLVKEASETPLGVS